MTKLAQQYPLTLHGCLELLALPPGEQPDKYQRAAMKIAVSDAIKRIAELEAEVSSLKCPGGFHDVSDLYEE